MKDRIFELGKQATFWCCDHNPADWDAAWEQKFAELIVRECVGLVNEQLQHNNSNDSLLALKIKEHFGVEE